MNTAQHEVLIASADHPIRKRSNFIPKLPIKLQTSNY